MSERISWLDGWRGIACYCMLVYHLLFDFLIFGWVTSEFLFSWPMVVFQKSIAFSFILCAGWSVTLSGKNIRRGLLVSAAGLVVVAGSWVAGAFIKFGVLQFLGLAILLYAFAGRWTSRIPEKLAPVLWLGLFLVTWVITEHVRVESEWLFWLGFRARGFSSADYVPMIPYVFLFLLGSWMGQMAAKYRERLPFLEKTAPAWLTWPGKRTLWIYILHQPVMYGICAAVYMFF